MKIATTYYLEVTSRTQKRPSQITILTIKNRDGDWMSGYSLVRSTAEDKFSPLEISSRSGSLTQSGSSTELSCDSSDSDSTLCYAILPNPMDSLMELVTKNWVNELVSPCYQSEVLHRAADKELPQERRKYD